MYTQKQAMDMVGWFDTALASQSMATPCIYEYNGEIGFSYGTNAHGTAAQVYEGTANVIVDDNEYRELHGVTKRDKAKYIQKKVNEAIQ